MIDGKVMFPKLGSNFVIKVTDDEDFAADTKWFLRRLCGADCSLLPLYTLAIFKNVSELIESHTLHFLTNFRINFCGDEVTTLNKKAMKALNPPDNDIEEMRKGRKEMQQDHLVIDEKLYVCSTFN